MQHADGRGIDGQPVHKVGGAVQRVQNPQEIGGRRAGGGIPAGGVILLAQDAMLGKPPRNLALQVGLRGLVGGGHRVLLRPVFVFYVQRAPEIAGQQRAGAGGELGRRGLNGAGVRDAGVQVDSVVRRNGVVPGNGGHNDGDCTLRRRVPPGG